MSIHTTAGDYQSTSSNTSPQRIAGLPTSQKAASIDPERMSLCSGLVTTPLTFNPGSGAREHLLMGCSVPPIPERGLEVVLPRSGLATSAGAGLDSRPRSNDMAEHPLRQLGEAGWRICLQDDPSDGWAGVDNVLDSRSWRLANVWRREPRTGGSAELGEVGHSMGPRSTRPSWKVAGTDAAALRESLGRRCAVIANKGAVGFDTTIS